MQTSKGKTPQVERPALARGMMYSRSVTRFRVEHKKVVDGLKVVICGWIMDLLVIHSYTSAGKP